MSRLPYLISALAVCLMIGVALADNPLAPLKIPEPEQFTRVGGSVYGKRVITTTGDSYLYTPASPTTSGAYTAISDLRLVAWNTPVTVTCAADSVACWTQTATLTVSTTSNLVGVITDANGSDGPGACFFAPAGIPTTDMPMRHMFSSSNDIGSRSGVCVAGTTAIANSWPCRVDGDCHSSATCSTSALNGVSPKARQSGAFLMLQTPGGASYCFVSESN